MRNWRALSSATIEDQPAQQKGRDMTSYSSTRLPLACRVCPGQHCAWSLTVAFPSGPRLTKNFARPQFRPIIAVTTPPTPLYNAHHGGLLLFGGGKSTICQALPLLLSPAGPPDSARRGGCRSGVAQTDGAIQLLRLYGYPQSPNPGAVWPPTRPDIAVRR